ncbi:MAG TPA: tetratricopeptide repeat protein [Methylomirabilota bacterium]|nr:tetratricopeptide repeat protein [Methylomirabilota bacterium]
MQAQDATTVYLLKLWPKIEANKNRIIAVAAAIAVVIAVAWIFSVQYQQKEVAAGEALTQLIVSQVAQPEAYFKIAAENPGTPAGQRAWLQGAAMLFSENKFAEAQTQFQKFLDEHPDNEFSGHAALGVAASLDAQGKTDLAADAYQRVVRNFSDATAANIAKLALARINEAQGKDNNAMINYQEVAQASSIQSLRQEAMFGAMNLKNKMPAAPASTNAPAAPFHLSQ